MQGVADALDKVRTAIPVDSEILHKQLVDWRTRLNDHVMRVHSRREPTRISVYEMQRKLLRMRKAKVAAKPDTAVD